MFRKLRFVASCISMAVAVTAGGRALAQNPIGPQAPAAPAPMAPAAPPPAPAAAAPMMAPATPQAPAAPLQANVPITDIVASAPCCDDQGCDEHAHHGCVYMPQMIGDGLNFVSGSAPPGTTLAAPLAPGHLPVALDGAAFKIADNESPHPEDRVFAYMQYFMGVLDNDHPPTAVFLPRIRYAVEVMGFEKTFLDGDASIGMRVPFFQIHSEDGAIDTSDSGDVTLIAKFALVNTECNVVSAGMAFTIPTGPNDTTTITNAAGSTVTVAYNPFIWQPFVGCVHNSGDLYVQGFSAMAIPFSRTVGWDWFNDLGVGWYAYRSDRALNALVPTAELHIATPLGHQGTQGFPVGEIDTWTVTLGTHMVFRDHAVFSVGWNFALSGPQPYTSGLLAQFNYHF